MDLLGIEPRSSSCTVSLSFTCVVAISLATEFGDSAPTYLPAYLEGCSGIPSTLPALVVDDPYLYEDYLELDRLLSRLESGSNVAVVVGNYVFPKYSERVGSPLTRKRTFQPKSKTDQARMSWTLPQVMLIVQDIH